MDDGIQSERAQHVPFLLRQALELENEVVLQVAAAEAAPLVHRIPVVAGPALVDDGAAKLPERRLLTYDRGKFRTAVYDVSLL